MVLRRRTLLDDRGFTIAGARRHLARPKDAKDAKDAKDSKEPAKEATPDRASGDLISRLKKEVRELLQLVDE
jgi:hypothetical protein